jgi:regulatory protein
VRLVTGSRKSPEPTLRERALKLLARREHSRKELGRKLAEHTDDPQEVERTLDECEARGWLSEKRVVEQLVHNRRSRFGIRRIERDLEAKGVSGDAVAAALSQLKEGEAEAARAVWRRKFGGRVPRNPAERARQARFLQGRGFELDVIFKVIEGEED